MDLERLEMLLDELATPLSRYTTARHTIVRLTLQNTDKPSASLRRLTGAIDSANAELTVIHELITDYAQDSQEERWPELSPDKTEMRPDLAPAP
jgi:hypothetical protein